MGPSTIETEKGTSTGILSTPQLSQIEQVRLALSPGRMGANLLQALGKEAGEHGSAASLTGAGVKKTSSPLRSLICRIVYMKYEPGEYCIILYQLDEQMVVGHIRWEAGATVLPSSDYQIPILGMAVYPYSQDPWLPGLAAASDPQVIAEALSKALPECQSGQARVLQVRASPQRYRPGKRLTLRLDIRLRDLDRGDISSRTYYAKVYHDPKKANSVFHEMQMMAEIQPAREGKVVLARAAVFLPELSMVLQEPVSGTPLEDLIGRMEGSARTGDARGWSGMQRAAAALAAVHTAGVVTKRQRPIQDELVRFQKRAKKIESVDAVQGRRMGELAAALPAWVGWLDEWGAELSLIHGDCKPSQFLIGDGRTPFAHVAILDFDHAGMADPANDVGTFLATLRQLALRQSLKALGDSPSAARAEWLLALEKRFLDDYCTASDRGEGFRLRATWYEAVGLMRKALRGFGRSPFSPLPDAMIAEAWTLLAEIASVDGVNTSNSQLPAAGRTIGRLSEKDV